MSQSMYDASTSDPMSTSMYGFGNGLTDVGSEQTELPSQFDSLCSNGDTQYPGYKEQGLLNGGEVENGGGSDTGPVPEGMLIDFGGQNQNPFEVAEPILQPEPISKPEPSLQPEAASQPETVAPPVIEPEPLPEPEPIIHPGPEPKQEPVPVEPEPVESVIQPQPVIQPEPKVKVPQEPVFEPEPIAHPEPISQPEPVQHPEPVPHKEPVSHPEPVLPPEPVQQQRQPEQELSRQTESKLEAGMSQLSESGSRRPDTVDDLITTKMADASLDRQLNDRNSENFVNTSLEQRQVSDSGSSKMEGGGTQETKPVNGDIQNTGYTQTSSSVTNTTKVNGEVTKVSTETTKIRQESRIPQKPPSPKKSGMPVRSPKKETPQDVGPGWDDSITVNHPRPPVSAHLLPRNMRDLPPEPIPSRPVSARSSVERKKYGIDSKRPNYKPGGGDVQIFSEKKEYRAEKRIDSRASSASRMSPKPGTPRTPPVNTPSPNLAGVKSKIGSMEKASHTPGGGNVRIVTKKQDFSSVSSRVGSKDKITHKPGGGNVTIENKKLTFDKVGSRVGSMDNAKHKAGGGDKKIETKSLNWEAKSKVGSLDNAKHAPGGGDKKIESKKLDWKVESRVGSMDNAKHKAGGGDKKILDEKLEIKAEAKIGSLKNVTHSPGGGDKAIETQKLNFRETAKARTKHTRSSESDTGSRRSNSVTSQSTTDDQSQ